MIRTTLIRDTEIPLLEHNVQEYMSAITMIYERVRDEEVVLASKFI